MVADPLTTVCCATTAHALWLAVGSGMIVGGLLYARFLIRRLAETHR
jgi:hypothetical protein